METPEILLTAGTTVVCSSLSSLLTWILSRKKYNSEVKGNDITNMQHSLDFYEDISDDQRSRLRALIDENTELREENIRIREENAQIRVENAAIRAENARVMKELGDLKLLVNRILENTCVNIACQIRDRGFAPYPIDKGSLFKEAENKDNENQ